MGPIAMYRVFAKLPLTIPEPTMSILRTIFSHGISIPPPTSWLSLGHFSSRAPGTLFSYVMARYARALSHLSKYMFIFDTLFRYCSLWVFGCYVCRYLLIGHRHHPFRYIYSSLACSLPHCIAFPFPVTPSDIFL